MLPPDPGLREHEGPLAEKPLRRAPVALAVALAASCVVACALIGAVALAILAL